jgi:hypothetical protein
MPRIAGRQPATTTARRGRASWPAKPAGPAGPALSAVPALPALPAVPRGPRGRLCLDPPPGTKGGGTGRPDDPNFQHGSLTSHV